MGVSKRDQKRFAMQAEFTGDAVSIRSAIESAMNYLDGGRASSAAIGNVVRALREDRGWTQAELGKRMGGMEQSIVGRKERGLISINPPERKQFAKVFGLSLEDFDSLWRGTRVE